MTSVRTWDEAFARLASGLPISTARHRQWLGKGLTWDTPEPQAREGHWLSAVVRSHVCRPRSDSLQWMKQLAQQPGALEWHPALSGAQQPLAWLALGLASLAKPPFEKDACMVLNALAPAALSDGARQERWNAVGAALAIAQSQNVASAAACKETVVNWWIASMGGDEPSPGSAPTAWRVSRRFARVWQDAHGGPRAEGDRLAQWLGRLPAASAGQPSQPKGWAFLPAQPRAALLLHSSPALQSTLDAWLDLHQPHEAAGFDLAAAAALLWAEHAPDLMGPRAHACRMVLDRWETENQARQDAAFAQIGQTLPEPMAAEARRAWMQGEWAHVHPGACAWVRSERLSARLGPARNTGRSRL